MNEHENEDLLSEQIHIRVTKKIKALMNQKAYDEGISVNAIAQKAVALYLTKDTMDESLLIAKMSDIQRQIARIIHEINLKQKLDLEWYQYFFLFAPPIHHRTVFVLFLRFHHKKTQLHLGMSSNQDLELYFGHSLC